MIELGYMAKHITARPDWLDVPHVRDIYSVCNCMSGDFCSGARQDSSSIPAAAREASAPVSDLGCDFIPLWKHNGFWFFDSPGVIRTVAAECRVSLDDTVLLYFRGHHLQFNRGAWTEYGADPGIPTRVVPPDTERALGYDVVSYSVQNAPEHSPLSCNHVASVVRVSEHCLIDSLEYAIECLENGLFEGAEPGPYRIVAVNTLPWPSAK